MKKYPLLILTLLPILLNAQIEPELNPIITLIPALEGNPDARTGGFGEIVMVAPAFYGNTGMIQNPALLVTHQKHLGAGVSYMPWLTGINPDMYFACAYASLAFNAKNALACHMKHFDMGPSFSYSSLISDSTTYFRPFEYYFQAMYARSLGKALSIGVGGKYITSDLDGPYQTSDQYKPVKSFAVDLGFTYTDHLIFSDRMVVTYQLGGAITNFGPRVEFSNEPDPDKYFIPTRLGGGILINPEFRWRPKILLNAEIAYQADKLLVPTPPVYDWDTGEILEGYDPDITAFKALYRSFYDAPDGFAEELREIVHRIGTEIRINYDDRLYLALRYGRFMENVYKGNRKYNTLGIGIGVFGFTLDYKVIPIGHSSALSNTFAVTAGFRTSLDRLFSF